MTSGTLAHDTVLARYQLIMRSGLAPQVSGTSESDSTLKIRPRKHLATLTIRISKPGSHFPLHACHECSEDGLFMFMRIPQVTAFPGLLILLVKVARCFLGLIFTVESDSDVPET